MKPLNIESAIRNFIFHCQYEKNLTQKTIKAYAIDLRQFECYLAGRGRSGDINTLEKEIIKDYLKVISTFKVKTVKRKIASLKAMFNYLEYEDEYGFLNPLRRIKIRIREERELPIVMSISEVKRLLGILYHEKGKCAAGSCKYLSVVRDIAIMELLFASGIRVSELCGLTNNNIDLKTGILKVFGKGRKERMIQICDSETRASLKDYALLYRDKIAGSEYFFLNRLGNPLSTQSVRLMIHKYAGKANILKNITPHTFRHTFATLLLEEDVDIRYIQNMLGHSSITTTQIYTHINSERQRKILRAKHPRRKFRLSAGE